MAGDQQRSISTRLFRLSKRLWMVFPHAFSARLNFPAKTFCTCVILLGTCAVVSLGKPVPENALSCANELSRERSFSSCVRQILQNELPISRKVVKARQGLDMSLFVAFAHHWDAGRDDVWNEEVRLLPDEDIKNQNCSVWEIGANVKAADSRLLMGIFPGCRFHAYEPVPTFASQLVDNWSRRPHTKHLHVHPYGLGARTYSFTMKEEAIAGESTFIEAESSGSVQIQIKSFEEAAKEANGVPNLISLNCEGCEWVLLDKGLDAGFLQQVDIIQIGWHNYGEQPGARILQLCELRGRLHDSHDLVSGVAFGWERWKKKKV